MKLGTGAIVAVLLLVIAATASVASPRRGSRAEIAYVAGVGVPHVWIARADGTQARRLGVGESALISPNGALVASIPWGFAGPMRLFSRSGKVVGRYLNAALESIQPEAWSPDSRYLAVSVSGGGRKHNRSWLAVIDTSRLRMITIARGPIGGASFAPDRTDRVVYSLDPGLSGPKSNLWIATADGRLVRRLTHDGWNTFPAWGVRGIAYSHAPGPNHATSINQVFLIQPDGSHRAQITHLKTTSLAYGLEPRQFSADGKRLLAAYITSGHFTPETWVIDIIAHRARRLTVNGQDVAADAISRDGTSVLVESTGITNPVVETISVGGGNPRVLAAGGLASWNR